MQYELEIKHNRLTAHDISWKMKTNSERDKKSLKAGETSQLIIHIGPHLAAPVSDILHRTSAQKEIQEGKKNTCQDARVFISRIITTNTFLFKSTKNSLS